MQQKLIQAVILVVIDRHSDSEDHTLAICELIKKELGGTVQRNELVPDDSILITTRVEHYVNSHSIDLLLTVGGSGFFPKSNAIGSVRKRIEQIRLDNEKPPDLSDGPDNSLNCIVHDKTLVINLPSPQSAAVEYLSNRIKKIEEKLKVMNNRKRVN
jgi:molybdopterin adenylyltransferase